MSICFLEREINKQCSYLMIISNAESQLIGCALCAINVSEFGFKYTSIDRLKEKNIVCIKESSLNKNVLVDLQLNLMIINQDDDDFFCKALGLAEFLKKMYKCDYLEKAIKALNAVQIKNRDMFIESVKNNIYKFIAPGKVCMLLITDYLMFLSKQNSYDTFMHNLSILMLKNKYDFSLFIKFGQLSVDKQEEIIIFFKKNDIVYDKKCSMIFSLNKNSDIDQHFICWLSLNKRHSLRELSLKKFNIFFDRCMSLEEIKRIKLLDNVEWLLNLFQNIYIDDGKFCYFLNLSEEEVKKIRLFIDYFCVRDVMNNDNKRSLLNYFDNNNRLSFDFVECNKNIFEKFNFEFLPALNVLFFSHGVTPLLDLLILYSVENKLIITDVAVYKNIKKVLVVNAFKNSVVYLNCSYSKIAIIDDESVKKEKLMFFKISIDKCIEILDFLQIDENNEIYQDFITLKILVDSYDRDNPRDSINIFIKHNEWRKLDKTYLVEKLSSSPHKIVFSNIKFNIQEKRQLMAVDFPTTTVTEEKFKRILDKLKIYINGEIQEKDRAFLEMIFPKRSIEDINKLIESFKLNQYLLSFFKADLITEIRYKWYKIIENMINAKTCKTEGFSEQEEIACGYINQIQMCDVGLNNGIEVAYSLLPVVGLLDAVLSNKDDVNALIYLTMIKNDSDFVDKINSKLDGYDSFWQLLDSNKLSKYISEVYLNKENLIPDKMRLMECDAHLLKDAISEIKHVHDVVSILINSCFVQFKKSYGDFIKKAVGDETVDVNKQGVHHELYIENFLNGMFSDNKPKYDSHTHVLDDKLVTMSHEELFGTFCNYFTTDYFIKMLTIKINLLLGKNLAITEKQILNYLIDKNIIANI